MGRENGHRLSHGFVQRRHVCHETCVAGRTPETEFRETLPQEEIRESDLVGLGAEVEFSPRPAFSRPRRKLVRSITAGERDKTRCREAGIFRDTR